MYVQEYQKQFFELQKKFFDVWLGGFPNSKEAFKLPDSLDKSIELQEELVKNYLAAEEQAMQLALETQKKFWDNYFELAKKAASTKVEVAA